MDADAIKRALSEVQNAAEPVEKHLLLAALCTKLFAGRGVELIVVGGSAIEFYTDGAYVSGDVDMCVTNSKRLSIRDRQELMGTLGAKGGPRSWEVAGLFLDILGAFETEAKTPSRTINTRLGPVVVAAAEDLLVERILVGKYPSAYPPALDCARKLIAAGLSGELEIDWNEVLRIAKLPAYKNEAEVRELIDSQAKTLAYRNPYDSNE